MSKKAVITGVSSGIGQAIKQKLEGNGWEVVGISRHLPMDEVGYEADLSQLEFVEPVATRAGEEHGPIDAFIHVAGVWHDETAVLAGKKLHEFTTPEIVKTMNVGLTSAMVFSARLMPFMNENASMLFISGAFEDGGANWLPYYTSKRALEDFIVGLAADEQRVQVYGVSPGTTATDSLKKFSPGSYDSAQSPEKVANTCMELIERRLSASTGTIVEVKNGTIGLGYHR
jgi:NAD(P)-dependent dehydrogenase (short-subunit alcohol dehydrogenase family)